MNGRRTLLIALSATLFTPGAVFAQAKKPLLVIGWLSEGPREAHRGGLAEFKKELAALGWQEGVNYVLEELYAEGQENRLPILAEELAARKPAVIVAGPVMAVVAAAKAAPQTPIVQRTGASPVDQGLAKSLSRPGGMVTGVINLYTELSEKFLELLLAAVPNLRRVGFLLDRDGVSTPVHLKNVHRGIGRFRLEARFSEVSNAEELDRALPVLAKEGVQALVVMPSPGLFNSERRRIVKFALTQRWPLVSIPSYAEDGALLGYGPDQLAMPRRVAYYVDRILKGTKPAELPIEQPMRFDLVVNLKTAKTLGLTMPPEIMVRATRLIE